MKHMPNSRSLRCPPESWPASRNCTGPSVSSSISASARRFDSRFGDAAREPGGQQVVERRHAREDARHLEHPQHAAARQPVRPQAGDVLAFHAAPGPSRGARKPDSMLSTVVLPEPLGPIRPRISPAAKRRS